MLVLARLRDQAIVIGDDIEVTVVDIRGHNVRLGITAPRTVSVHRKEVYEAIRRENQSAAKMRPEDLPGGASAGSLRLHKPEAAAASPASEADAEAHRPFLQAAIEEAKQGLAEGGLPIGSVLVRDGRIIGRGRNRRIQKGDPMAHAEIDAFSNAGRQQTYRDVTLYSTLMPCYLCSGAAVQFGTPKVVVGESVNFAGAPDFLRKHGVEAIDLRDEQCIRMMGEFIKADPTLWREDIGK